ncbi:acyl-CoA dehydrogenase (plasmid) [Azospirillum baldaniorum]|uniref:Acyl-CoA dehydrogenase n=1 Tax=Azospirillum baldaniorum TaxID=1064539 RepID=A0A9P1NQF5_9PROT|nr:acyl-CoA dehydrogenase family protein [Azospirillum baldaniorum]AWJ93797.1 acyl-CoA dehydrogenase [Azospirillum baldaniorum]TWA71022.1 acyl-CoA dehydrogenase [Azospirillum brasilense]CCD01941.1 putative acyl-CoA dehydrogenase [Azospirillum baldaniorum]
MKAPAPDSLPAMAAEAAAGAASEAAAIAGRHADSVDREARFPAEAFASLKEARLLGLMVPRAFGGGGGGLTDAAAVAHALAQKCPSTGLIYAMHQIQVACLVRHGQGSDWHRGFLKRLAEEQLLLASATTEAGIGGDVRSSACAVTGTVEGETGGAFRLEKQATVISYGAEADAILVTARRTADSPPSDQVIVPVLRGQTRLEEIGGWDTLGMRGTRSVGYRLVAEAERAQILPLPYADISARTMLPVTHILWSSVWLGIATDAVARAAAFIRAEARKRPGTPPGARRLAEATAGLQAMRGMVRGALARFEEAADNPDRLTSLGFAVAMNTLKTEAAEMVVRIVGQAMLAGGLSAYRNDSPHSLGRHLRDAHSAPLMINNDRILGNTANLLLAHRDNGSLFG